MDWYNGYSPDEREAMGRARLKSEAPVSATTPPCAICLVYDPSTIQTHAEDYMTAVHVGTSRRLSHLPTMSFAVAWPLPVFGPWSVHREFVRDGWYGHEITTTILSRAVKSGVVPTCLDPARPKRPSTEADWWDVLTLDPASLRDPGMRRQT